MSYAYFPMSEFNAASPIVSVRAAYKLDERSIPEKDSRWSQIQRTLAALRRTGRRSIRIVMSAAGPGSC